MISQVVTGLIGWSNNRRGVEFYRFDSKIIPRHGSKWGDLLAFEGEIPKKEGCPIIMIVLPRFTLTDEVQVIERLVRAVIEDRMIVKESNNAG